MLTPRESMLIVLRRVRLEAPCRSPPRHCGSERGRHDTGTAAPPHHLCTNKDRKQTCDRNCSTAFRNTHKRHCTEPWRIDISNCFSLEHLGCRVMFSATVLMTRCGGTLQPSKCQWRALSLQLRAQSAQFGSDTVPHQLENNPRVIPATQTPVNVFLKATIDITEAATHPSQQPDDANCSHLHAK